jgi:Tol biopolymer transport system component
MLRWLTLLLPLSLLTLVSIAGAARREPPAARWLVFVSSRDGALDLYRMNSDGSGVRRLTKGRAFQYDPSWSPDGRWIAFTSELNNSADIFLMRPDGSKTQAVAAHAVDDTNPRWSPDGEWIAFNSGFDIYMVRRDGTQMRQLTHSPEEFDLEPMWSPDGEWLYFFSGKGLNIVGNLHRIDLKTGAVEQVATGVNRLVPVLWTKDTRRLLIIKDDFDTTLHSIRPDGSDDMVLLERRIGQLAWCPDEECLLLTINGLPHRLSMTGGSLESTEDPRLIAYLRGQPGPDGSRVAFAQETDSGHDVFVYFEGEIVNLTNHPGDDFNPQWMPIHDLKWHPMVHILGIGFAFIVKQGLRIMM